MEKTNIYGVVLAGGKGTRMGNVEKPKQFMEVGGKPIIIHTLEKFVVNPQFERVIVLSPKQWITYTQDIIKKYILLSDKIDVIEGGATRNDTIMNAISHIEKFYGLDEETIIVTHDSVRPFVTHRILEDNLHWCGKNHAWLERTAEANTVLISEILLLVGNETEDYFLLKKESRHSGSSRKKDV